MPINLDPEYGDSYVAGYGYSYSYGKGYIASGKGYGYSPDYGDGNAAPEDVLTLLGLLAYAD